MGAFGQNSHPATPNQLIAAEGLYGIRAWLIGNHGLNSIAHWSVWKTGVNHAQCLVGNGVFRNIQYGERLLEEDHQVACKSCSCGFYAYWGEVLGSPAEMMRSYVDDNDPSNVIGVIRAYGRITYGTRGMRAEKAEIVAAVDPYWGRGEPVDPNKTPTPQEVEQTFWGKHQWWFLGAYGVLLSIGMFGAVLGWKFAAVFSFGAIIPFVGFMKGQSNRRAVARQKHLNEMLLINNRNKPDANLTFDYDHARWLAMQQIKKDYPDIRWFPDRDSMIAEYPITKYADLPKG